MRALRPVVHVVDQDVPESGYFTDPSQEWPTWMLSEVAETFFGRKFDWLRTHIRAGHVPDADIPRLISNEFRVWRLYDVERTAETLAERGYLSIAQLYRTKEIVRLVAESHGMIPPKPVPLRTLREGEPEPESLYAMEQQVELTDDLDGSPGASTRRFALGDVEYVLELTEAHWNDLVATLGPYIHAARRQHAEVNSQSERTSRHKIREWARAHGYQVADKGRIPSHVLSAYLRRDP